MIEIGPVVRSDIETLISRRLAPDQAEFVVPNVVTLAGFAYVFLIRSAVLTTSANSPFK